MGHQARLRALRRAEAQLEAERERALDVLRSLWMDVQRISLTSPIRSWQLLLELLARASGWPTETGEAAAAGLDSLPLPERLGLFGELYADEVTHAHAVGRPLPEPLGELLREICVGAGLPHQVPDPADVRSKNRQVYDHRRQIPGQLQRSMELFSGTGRGVMDALVHYADLVAFAVEPDLWLYRAGLLNARFLGHYTNLLLADQPSALLEDPTQNELVMHAGRFLSLHAHPFIVDLNHMPNWTVGLFGWTPPAWEQTLKINRELFDFDGTWADLTRTRTMDDITRRLQSHLQRHTPPQFDFIVPSAPRKEPT